MDIRIKTTNYELSANASDFVDKKVNKIERLLHDAATAQFDLELEELPKPETDGARYRVQANLQAGGRLYRAEVRAPQLDAAVEKMRHEIEKEIRRSQGKARRMVRTGAHAFKRALRGWR